MHPGITHHIPFPTLSFAMPSHEFKIFIIVYSPLHTLAMGLAIY